MKHAAFTFLLILASMISKGQAMIASPNALYLVYNNPGSYFYLKIDGKDKSTTEINNLYIVDGQSVQVLTVKTSTFIPDSLPALKPRTMLERYYAFEKGYLDTLFQGQISYSTEFGQTANGREYIFWSFRSPLLDTAKESATDSTKNTIIESQLYAATDVGKLIVAVSAPYFKEDIAYEKLKKYLIDIIGSITVSPVRIDIFELDRRVNGTQ